MPRKQINDEKLCRKLRKHGGSKEMSAASRTLPPPRRGKAASKGGHTKLYEGPRRPHEASQEGQDQGPVVDQEAAACVRLASSLTARL